MDKWWWWLINNKITLCLQINAKKITTNIICLQIFLANMIILVIMI